MRNRPEIFIKYLIYNDIIGNTHCGQFGTQRLRRIIML